MNSEYTAQEVIFSITVEDLRSEADRLLGRELTDENLPELFRNELSKALFYEEFSSGQIQEVMKLADKITIANTNNRSVLASMNWMVYEYECTLSQYQHLGDEGIIVANRKLNRMLRGAIGEGRNDYGVPIERFKEMITTSTIEKV